MQISVSNILSGSVTWAIACLGICVPAILCDKLAGAGDLPPIYPGLWEQHQAQKLNGLDIEVPQILIDQARQAGVAMAGNGRSERICVTAENIASIGQPTNAALPACRKENVRLSPAGLSLDLICSDAMGSGRGTVNVSFDSPTYYHGTFTFTGTHALFGGNALPLTIDGKVTGHWLSPSCNSNSH